MQLTTVIFPPLRRCAICSILVAVHFVHVPGYASTFFTTILLFAFGMFLEIWKFVRIEHKHYYFLTTYSTHKCAITVLKLTRPLPRVSRKEVETPLLDFPMSFEARRPTIFSDRVLIIAEFPHFSERLPSSRSCSFRGEALPPVSSELLTDGVSLFEWSASSAVIVPISMYVLPGASSESPFSLFFSSSGANTSVEMKIFSESSLSDSRATTFFS